MNFIRTKFQTALFVLLLITSCSSAQKKGERKDVASTAGNERRKPALIVGIVVDQMRQDYIEKFWDDFSSGGFRRIVGGGFSVANMHYNYTPTYTGPGHAAIYTGATPAYNGIVANDWYVRSNGFLQYCAGDTSVSGVGSQSPAARMSPVHLKSSTIGDELRLFSNQRSKVIGVGIKDRGAILPAGRMANAAYWYAGGSEDKWVTSSWYGMDRLPEWATEFNSKGLGGQYLSEGWNLLLPESQYDESMSDNNPFEGLFRGLTRPVFPYDLGSLRESNGNFDLLKGTPWGNTLTTDFAMATLQGEGMGKGTYTDMLCISYSSTDIVGHQFGIHSRELQDCYLRLDGDIARLLEFLDQWVGQNNYLLFLTADHGAAPTPGYVARMGSGAAYFRSDLLEDKLEAYLGGLYGEGDWVSNESNQHIYLNRKLIEAKGLSRESVQRLSAHFLREIDGVAQVFCEADLSAELVSGPFGSRIQLGFNQKLGGDLVYSLEPGWMQNALTGTTHGSGYEYDTHVPALFYGFGIQPGESWTPQDITDIAPTVAAVCRIPFPDACIGQPIKPIVK